MISGDRPVTPADIDTRIQAADAREHAPEALVERMARAMWEVIAVRSAGVRDPAPWGCLGEHTRDTYRGLATAALRVVTERADGAL